MASTSNTVRRALTNASQSITSSPRAASANTSTRRLMGTASAAALPIEEQPIDIQIFDIFDAPSRLGESSKMLAQASATFAARAPAPSRAAAASDYSGSGINHVNALPAPIIYDGPARPGSRVAGGYRAQRGMSGTAAGETTLFSSLPPPVVFDGPSKLRPYGRDVSGQTGFSTTTALAAAAAAGLALYGYNKAQELSEEKRSDMTI